MMIFRARSRTLEASTSGLLLTSGARQSLALPSASLMARAFGKAAGMLSSARGVWVMQSRNTERSSTDIRS